MRASLLGVHLDKSKLIPDALNEIVQARFGSTISVGNQATNYRTYFKPSSQLMTTV